MRVYALEGAEKDYAWGSPTAIPALRGTCAPDPNGPPVAELWLGAHPGGACRVEGRGTLAEWIEAEPEAVLGARVVARFGPQLPFLVKLLAAAKPLSIQAHPDAAQARRGFARENAAGIPLDAPTRSYRDTSHKPELVCALTPFRALVGFREPPPGQDLRTRFENVLALSPDEVRRFAEADPRVAALAREFPGDPGALAPLFLNELELAPGEAVYLESGVLHTYLEGLAVEVMASSDNVLRGGLTPKHVDRAELLRVLRFEATRPVTVRPDPHGVYHTPAAEFELRHVAAPFESEAERGIEILVCVEGEAEIDGLRLAAGAAAVAPAAAGRYRVAGDARLYRARVPC